MELVKFLIPLMTLGALDQGDSTGLTTFLTLHWEHLSLKHKHNHKHTYTSNETYDDSRSVSSMIATAKNFLSGYVVTLKLVLSFLRHDPDPPGRADGPSWESPCVYRC